MARLSAAQLTKNAKNAAAYIDTITEDMAKTSGPQFLARQSIEHNSEVVSYLERWYTGGTKEVVVHQKEENGERCVWRYVGAEKDMPKILKKAAVEAAGQKRAKRGRQDEAEGVNNDDDDVEVQEPAAKPAAARRTAGSARARKAAAAPQPQRDDPFVTPANNREARRSSSRVPSAPKKARHAPRESLHDHDSDEEDGEATETENTPRAKSSKKKPTESNSKASKSLEKTNVTLRRSTRTSRSISECSETTEAIEESLDELRSLCGGIDGLGFTVADRDTEMGRGSVARGPIASTSRVKIEHSL